MLRRILIVVCLATVGCSASKTVGTATTTSTTGSTTSSQSSGAQSSSTTATSSSTTTQPANSLEGSWKLSAPADQCALDVGSLNGETLTVHGTQATITNQYGNFVGPVTGQGPTYHISADQQLTDQPTDTSFPLPPPHLDLDVTVTGDTIQGNDQYSAVSPGGQTGFSCQRTFGGVRNGASPSTPAGLADGPNYNTGGAAGSGCSPGDVASLPDGWWAGTVASYVGTTVDFDLVCYFTGDAANAAAAQDGQPTPVDDDRYVRNSNPKTFHEVFNSRGVPATCTDLGAQHFPCTVGDVLDLYAHGVGPAGTVAGHQSDAFPYVWVHVTNGQPDSLYMQFTP